METWPYHAQRVAPNRKAHASDGLTILAPGEVRVANAEAGDSVLR
jgi:hypothetical protein